MHTHCWLDWSGIFVGLMAFAVTVLALALAYAIIRTTNEDLKSHKNGGK